MADQAVNQVPDIPCPRFDLQRVYKIRNRLLDEVLHDLVGFAPVGDDFDDFVRLLTSGLPGADAHAVRCSVQHLAGVRLTHEVLLPLTWRLAANIQELKGGRSVLPRQGVTDWTWMPVLPYASILERTSQGRDGARFSLRVLAGVAAGATVGAIWSLAFCRAVGVRVGYTRPARGLPMLNYSELCGLYMAVLLPPGQSFERPLRVMRVHCPLSMLQRNRRIVQRRHRRDGNGTFVCPQNYQWPCFRCPIGMDTCPQATHLTTRVESSSGKQDVNDAANQT